MRQSAARGATGEPVPTHGSYILAILASERRRWGKRVGRPAAITSLALLVALGAFICLQVVSVYGEFWHELSAWVRLRGTPSAHLFDPTFRYLLSHPSPIPLWLRQPYLATFAAGITEFTVLTVVGVAAAIQGGRRFFWAPAVAWSLSPMVWGLPENLGRSRAPFIVGDGLAYLIRPGWLAAAVGLILVLGPGATAAAMYRPTARAGDSDRLWRFVGLGCCVLLFLLWLSTKSSVGGSPQDGWTSDLPMLLPLFVFGAALSGSMNWWWLLLPLVPTIATIWWVSSVELLPVQTGVIIAAIPAPLFAAALGVGWRPIGAGLNQLRSHVRLNLFLVNGLNLADALLSEFFVHRGQAVEANPVVRAIGLPLKVVLVLVASWVLFRVRPKALIWPVILLSMVLAWHISGLWLNAALLGAP